MNRCSLRHLPHVKAPMLAVAALAAIVLLAPAAAQTPQRIPPIAPAAQGGVLVVTNPPEVLLNGQAARLSPGARIHGYNNLLVMSGSLVGQKLPVRYVREPMGSLHEVWILTDAEVAAFSRAKP